MKDSLGKILSAIFVVTIALVAWLVFYVFKSAPSPQGVAETIAPPQNSFQAKPSSELQYSPLADELLSPNGSAKRDLEVLIGLLGQFTTTLRRNERPPLGDNADITKALTGNNRRQFVAIPEDHPAVRNGHLMDRWGTPFHFHPRSAEDFDVRSAGPDRVLFTDDDIAFNRLKGFDLNP